MAPDVGCVYAVQSILACSVLFKRLIDTKSLSRTALFVLILRRVGSFSHALSFCEGNSNTIDGNTKPLSSAFTLWLPRLCRHHMEWNSFWWHALFIWHCGKYSSPPPPPYGMHFICGCLLLCAHIQLMKKSWQRHGLDESGFVVMLRCGAVYRTLSRRPPTVQVQVLLQTTRGAGSAIFSPFPSVCAKWVGGCSIMAGWLSLCAIAVKSLDVPMPCLCHVPMEEKCSLGSHMGN